MTAALPIDPTTPGTSRRPGNGVSWGAASSWGESTQLLLGWEGSGLPGMAAIMLATS